jgi:hypothetical protein
MVVDLVSTYSSDVDSYSGTIINSLTAKPMTAASAATTTISFQ